VLRRRSDTPFAHPAVTDGYPLSADELRKCEEVAHRGSAPRVLCRCDGYGLVVDHSTGLIVKCEDCGGKALTNAEVRELRGERKS
jgi:hypothetical protein